MTTLAHKKGARKEQKGRKKREETQKKDCKESKVKTKRANVWEGGRQSKVRTNCERNWQKKEKRKKGAK